MTNTASHLKKLSLLKLNLERVIQGKSENLDLIITALIAGGSILLEDVPGVGKTTLAKALAKSFDATFNRVQFTPDLLPADILGSSIYNPTTGAFTFKHGPVFSNVLLADEINRASPRTQSALLESMSELQATIEGTRYPLPVPFLVIATENPVEFHGTYPLPEAQLDRFLVLLRMGYPSPEVEVKILYSQAESHPLDSTTPVMNREELIEIQKAVRMVQVEESVSKYIVQIVQKTRQDSRLKLGVSPRGTLMLFRAAQAAAFLNGRNFVIPDDVQRLASSVLAHRLVLHTKAKYAGVNKDEIVQEILKSVEVPT